MQMVQLLFLNPIGLEIDTIHAPYPKTHQVNLWLFPRLKWSTVFIFQLWTTWNY